jgi:hypothetical protein
MPVDIAGQCYYALTEVAEELRVTRQSLWLWRKSGKIPVGRRTRARQVLFTEAEVMAIREYANRLEPIELGGARQMRLFGQTGSKEGA